MMTTPFLAPGSASPIDLASTWLVQSTLLLALGLLAGRALMNRGSAVRSAAYRTALVAVLACPVVSAVVASMGLPGLTIRLPGMSANAQGPGSVGPDVSTGRPATPTATDRRPALEPVAEFRPKPIEPSAGSDRAILSIQFLVSAWLGVAAILVGRLLVGVRRMARLRASAIPAGPEAEALCRQIAGRMRLRSPTILRSPFLTSPCLDGLRRPAILLLEDSDPHLREILVHELAHLGRRDLAWNLLRQLATATLWFQPLLWVLSRRVEESAEEACDDFVVASGGDRRRYAGHLLDLAGRRLPPRSPSMVGMISRRSPLARRIARILDLGRSTPTRAGRPTFAGIVMAGLAGTILAGLTGVGGEGRDLLADEPRPAEADRVPQDRGNVAIAGRVVDAEGQPIPGVSVKVNEVSRARGGNLDPWLDAVGRGEAPWVAYRHLEPIGTKPTGRAQTDAQGRFRIEGRGAEEVVVLLVEGPTIAHTRLQVATRPIEPLAARGFSNRYGSGSETIYGNELAFKAAPGRVVEGIVRDARDGKPLKDVEVQSDRFAGAEVAGITTLRTRTDDGGRFRLAGFSEGAGNKLLIVPNDDQPYFMREFALPDAPGLGPISAAIDLHEGIWIEGKLTDRETGAPVEGAWLHYLPFVDNKFASSVPEFHPGGYVDGFVHQDRYVSKEDGTFRLVGLPGRAIVGAVVYHGKPYRRGAGFESIRGMDLEGHFATYSNPVIASRFFPTAMREVDPAEGAAKVRLDITLDPGAKVRLRAVDPRGEPSIGLKTGGLRERGENGVEPSTQADLEVITLGPDEDRPVWLVDEARKIGRAIRVKPGDDRDGPVVVTLEPCATINGRVVDLNGRPVPGATVRPILKPGGDFFLALPEVAAGVDGRFTIFNVPTGSGYTVTASSPLRIQQRGRKGAAVRAGETTDLGDISLDD